jgi:hypothetical protein
MSAFCSCFVEILNLLSLKLSNSEFIFITSEITFELRNSDLLLWIESSLRLVTQDKTLYIRSKSWFRELTLTFIEYT